MENLTDRIYRILERPVLAALATVTADGKPWVRYVMAMAGPDLVVRCATFVSARKVRQIADNPEVHLTCGVTNPAEVSPYLQIQGRAELNISRDTRHAFWTDMLLSIFAGPDDPEYGVVEITPYYIEYCTSGSFEPEIWTP
jgi:general stress protein 26